eukprot:2547107-Prymnesium_polylepis.2
MRSQQHGVHRRCPREEHRRRGELAATVSVGDGGQRARVPCFVARPLASSTHNHGRWPINPRGRQVCGNVSYEQHGVVARHPLPLRDTPHLCVCYGPTGRGT